MKSTKEELLKNAGKAIEKFRKLKKMSAPVMARKTKIKIAIINEICSGKKLPTKKEIGLICKALDIPKSMLLLYSITEKDVPKRKREIYNELIPSIKGMMEGLLKTK